MRIELGQKFCHFVVVLLAFLTTGHLAGFIVNAKQKARVISELVPRQFMFVTKVVVLVDQIKLIFVEI